MYEGYYDSNSKKLYASGVTSSGYVAGVDISPYIGGSGTAFFVVSVDIATGMTFHFFSNIGIELK